MQRGRNLFNRHAFLQVRKLHQYHGKNYLHDVPTWGESKRPILRSSPNFASRNIYILGPPGSGKSTVCKHLSLLNGMPILDIDDQFLEKNWGCTVAEKLARVGDDAFVAAEGAEMMKLDVKGTIVSLSGSNPLHAPSLHHLAQNGIIVYLDTPKDDILARCNVMKVDRIVGQSTRSLGDILDSRAAIYENSYDLRIMVETNTTPEQIAKKIYSTLCRSEEYISTRGYGNGQETEFTDVVKRGLAPDRGLFIAKNHSKFTANELTRLVGLSYPELALRVMEKFPLGSLHPSRLRHVLYDGYSTFLHPRVLPLSHLSDKYWLMETYHGPTASFKDLSLQLLPKLLYTSMQIKTSPEHKITGLLVATSGDTGTAALDGFTRIPNTPVVVLYPARGVSVTQRAQMVTCESENACVIGVKSDFDFCQTTVKDIFNDQALNNEFSKIVPGLQLSSANSINWGRLLPQVVFTFSSYIQLVEQGVIKIGDPIDVCIPTGNFGNMLGAVFAKRLGLPLRRLISASNENNVIADFIRTGEYDIRHRSFRATISPSIDILVSSNLERLLYLLSNGDSELVTKLFTQLSKEGHFKVEGQLLKDIQQEITGEWCGEEECMNTIQQVYKDTKRVIDPHTAVAVAVAKRLTKDVSDKVPMTIASTAHFAKFPDTMTKALGDYTKINDSPDRVHPEIEKLESKKHIHDTVVNADKENIATTIKEFLMKFAKRL
jgi:threonine synthase